MDSEAPPAGCVGRRRSYNEFGEGHLHGEHVAIQTTRSSGICAQALRANSLDWARSNQGFSPRPVTSKVLLSLGFRARLLRGGSYRAQHRVERVLLV